MATPETHEQRASRACMECRISKTRCIWPADMGVGKCRRCSRSKRACTFMGHGTTKRNVSSRVDQLEEKINGIVSLLQASQTSQSTTPTSSPREQQQQQQQSIRIPRISGMPPQGMHEEHIKTPSSSQSAPTGIPVSPATSDVEIIPEFRLAFDEADRHLQLYRTSFSPDFPFVPMPSMTTANQLYTTKPLLFRVVMHVVAPQTYPIQLAFGRWLQEYMAQHAVVGQEKSLEIVQGILLYISWADFRVYRGNEATNLLQLALGQVVDMGLSQPPREPTPALASMPKDALLCCQKVSPRHSYEQMRAMLGCYFLCSNMATLFRKMAQFPYTRYLTACCAELEAAHEYESDQLLVALIRMQRLICRSIPAMPSPEMDGIGTVPFSTSLSMTMSTTQNELESLKSSLPQDLQDNAIFSTNYYGTLVRLYEPAIYTQASRTLGDESHPNHRTEALCQCLDMTMKFFEAFLSIPAERFSYPPFPIMGRFSFGIMAATWLLFLQDSDWDVATARKSFDFACLVDRISTRYEESDRVEQAEVRTRKRKFWDENHTSLAMRYRDKIQWVKSWYLAEAHPTPELLTELSETDADLFRLFDFQWTENMDLEFVNV